MPKKIITMVLSVVFLTILFIGLFKMYTHAAVCTPTDGTACEGECCKLTKDGCIAGPCDKLLK